MSAGITRVHGTALVPSQRPSTLSFFTITFDANIKTTATTTSDIGVVDGALDRIFRTAIPTVAVVGMIGTVASNGLTLRFAIEDTGADSLSPSYLGMGPGNGAGSDPDSTAAAIQAAIVALGTVNGMALANATVAAFVL
jgi:hypothetical protein